ncbi:MAG: hypothetical protein ACR2QK_17470, partial [Acidimicrobiales bacterium]
AGTAQAGAEPTPAAAPAPTGTDRQPLGETAAVTQLALTGMVTEPWVIVIFAMGLIFFGYTVYAAFQHRPKSDETCGHDQLDSLGFD